MNTSDILNKAADLIEEHGWRNDGGGWFSCPPDPMCVEGALRVAAHSCTTSRAEAAMHYRRAKSELAAHVGMYPWVWNDRVSQSATEVIEVLRAAALIESARERETAQVSA
jgi:hypothetical protein